eukprot:CAMPEP_0198229568 /NCGR_PEP_ID=MMETSP1445-20131203/114188_1 /TAXON_ID=36898 /ORGANISM="Pyramimonas sp., Strain CCMP2087" /LENGTH=77 /DNA_ID=CAMNT_0043910031 /DNA_START=2220 /DNA_END=2453 /DNA_ORIENTATION=-
MRVFKTKYFPWCISPASTAARSLSAATAAANLEGLPPPSHPLPYPDLSLEDNTLVSDALGPGDAEQVLGTTPDSTCP